ncbi:Carbonyl reductase [NADPH] 2 [Orchesella cincta]|uniref:Carbonyl reductase [NADPH] 2 n=1 Tax=Orchesella cincta TaxID=48709 RepID=A0A1D2M3L7_ORCCI|nr:Carbonyl reductase [NADPH] 2 [Orchesella cincta]
MSSQNNFTGVKVLVTGAGRGIGRAIVTELHARGAIVYALSKNPDNLASLKEQCPKIISICADLTDLEQTQKAVEPIEAVDCLINNAGIMELADFLGISPEHFERQFSVNLNAVVFLSQIIVKKMIAAGNGGSILNMSSILGQRPVKFCGIYNCTKAALDMLTKSMALELAVHKIRVNSLNSGMVQTDLISGLMGQEIDPKEVEKVIMRLIERTPTQTSFMPMSDIVNTALFLASNQTSQITGQCLAVDGGI